MPQVFPRSTNTLAKVSLLGSLLLTAFAVWFCLVYARSSYGTGAGIARVQPVPFSHEHHVGGLGIDCRYCHTSVESSSYAGLPPTKTCMNCHSQIWFGSAFLEPVRESYRTDRSIEWERVHRLADFVYFDHSIHVKKGIGCASCHGKVQEMQLTRQVASLHMEWCLDCHRHPEEHVRPRSEIFNMEWDPGKADQAKLGARLVAEYNIRRRTDCSTCHR